MCDSHFFKISEGGALWDFSSIFYVNKEEWSLWVQEGLLGVTYVATFDLVVVEQLVGHLHECLMHAVLGVKEIVVVANIN